jgi:solute carrier family 45 protein 1/2/4
MYGWAPLALMGEEINKLETPTRNRQMYSIAAQQEEEPFELTATSNNPAHASPADIHRAGEPSSQEDGNLSLAGAYLGIWNIYATVPQFLATFISMVVFRIFEPGRGAEYIQGNGAGSGGMSGTAVRLTIGAVCSLIAATLIFRLRKP